MEASTLTYASRSGLLARRSTLLRLQRDDKLIALIREHHDRAFEVLFDRYQSRLLAFCRGILGSSEDAEDVLQEVFVNAHAAMLSDSRPINVRPWLYRIARNRCLNHLRKPVAQGQDSMDIHQSNGASTPDCVQKREELRAIFTDVGELPETQRTALVLREIDDLAYEEIAEAMGTTLPAVKSLLVRARMSLAEASESRVLDCTDVRLRLAEAAEGLGKLQGPERHHVKKCEGCGRYRRELRSSTRALAGLAPLPLLWTLKKVVAAKLFGGSGSTGAASSAGSAGSAGGAGATGAGATGAGAGATGAAGAGAGSAGIGAGAVGAGTSGVAIGGGAAGAGIAGSGVAGSGLAGGALGAVGAKAATGFATAAILAAGTVGVQHLSKTDRTLPAAASHAAMYHRATTAAVTAGTFQRAPAKPAATHARAPAAPAQTSTQSTPSTAPTTATTPPPPTPTSTPATAAPPPTDPTTTPQNSHGGTGTAVDGSGGDSSGTGGSSTPPTYGEPPPTTTPPTTITPPPTTTPLPTTTPPPVTPPLVSDPPPPPDPPPPTTDG